MGTRRHFLKSTTAAGLVAPTAGALLASQPAPAQADHHEKKKQELDPKKGVIFIGAGIRFHTYLGKAAMKHRPCRAICDVDSVQAGRALQVAMDVHRERDWPIDSTVYEDYQEALQRDDFDTVVIGSPDHWHTKQVIDSLRAGKDVYCEKPLTLTIREGNQILKVLEETGRVMQVGTQQRTGFGGRFAKAVAMAHDNRVGKINRVTVALGGSRSCEPLPVAEVPRQLNWDLYQGQVATTDYREGPLLDTKGWGAGHPFSRTHRYYRWWYEYSGGKLTDWGAHHVDIAMWALDKLGRDIGKVTIDPQMVEHPVPFQDGMPTDPTRFNAATTFKVLVTFDDGIEMLVTHHGGDLGFDNGVMFEGEKGRYLVNRGKLVGKPVEDLEKNPLPEDAFTKLYGGNPSRNHMTNFYDCVASREQPVSDVASHHRMLSICHGINIAMRLGRKLTFDTATDTFVGDDQANSFVERKQRAGFEINA